MTATHLHFQMVNSCLLLPLQTLSKQSVSKAGKLEEQDVLCLDIIRTEDMREGTSERRNSLISPADMCPMEVEGGADCTESDSAA